MRCEQVLYDFNYPNFFSFDQEDNLLTIIAEIVKGALCAVYNAFEELAGLLDEFLSKHELTKDIPIIAKKVILFVRRHKMAFFTYAVSVGLMAAMGATPGQIAQACIPGLVWTLANVKGEILPEDLMEEIDSTPQATSKNYFPEQLQDVIQSPALTQRVDLMGEVKKNLQTPEEKGWVLLHGAPRIGKSTIAKKVLEEAKTNGQTIYKFTKEIYDTDSKNAYLAVADKLNEIGQTSALPPILYIDEFGKIDKKQFMAIYEQPNKFNVLAVQSNSDECNFNENEFYGRFTKFEVHYLEVEGCILTLQNSYLKEHSDIGITDGMIEELVKGIAARKGYCEREKLLNLSIVILENIRSQLKLEEKVTMEILKDAMQKHTLNDKNCIELIVDIEEGGFWSFASENNYNESESLKSRHQVIQECANRLKYGWAYLNGPASSNCELCVDEVIRIVREEGQSVYKLNKHYFKEKTKFMSVDEMWMTMFEALNIVARNSEKPPILFLDLYNKGNIAPSDVIRKYAIDPLFHIFVLDKKGVPSDMRNFFVEFVRLLPMLDKEAVEFICMSDFPKEDISDDMIKAALDAVEKNLQKRCVSENDQVNFTELYQRTKRILCTTIRHKFDEEGMLNYINTLDWNNPMVLY